MTDAAAFPSDPSPPPSRSPRDRVVEATMELAAERDWSDFGLPEVAARAGVSLAELRDLFPSKGAVLGALSKSVDRAVLEGATTDTGMESAKERLFDVLMRRLDALGPYKLGLESVAEWARTDMATAAALNAVALNSMRFMCAAAGINVEGPTGPIKLQGLVLAWLKVLGVWFEDTDPGLARTMAALDRELERGGTLARRVDDLDRFVSPLRLLGRAMMDTRRRLKERRSGDVRASRDEGGEPPVEAGDPAI